MRIVSMRNQSKSVFFSFQHKDAHADTSNELVNEWKGAKWSRWDLLRWECFSHFFSSLFSFTNTLLTSYFTIWYILVNYSAQTQTLSVHFSIFAQLKLLFNSLLHTSGLCVVNVLNARAYLNCVWLIGWSTWKKREPFTMLKCSVASIFSVLLMPYKNGIHQCLFSSFHLLSMYFAQSNRARVAFCESVRMRERPQLCKFMCCFRSVQFCVYW